MVLYHASTLKNLSYIRPQRTLSRDRYIGDFVFATANVRLAHMYLTPVGIVTLMNPSNDNPNIVLCIKQEEFIKQDKGGAVYELSSESFIPSPQKEISDYEMVSTTAVKPTKKTVYNKTLDALLSLDIKVRFVDQSVFYNLIKHPDQKKLIKEIQPYRP